MTTAAIIQARLGSTRLPSKVLLDLCGKTVLERVVERVRAARQLQGLVLATTTSRSDDVLEQFCERTGILCFRGSEEDVLDRFYQAARHYGMRHVVRITADCPLMDPSVIDDVVAFYRNEAADYASNTIEETYPDGEDVEVFSFEALEKAWQQASLRSEREHVTPYLKKNPSLFKAVNLRCGRDLSCHRWTLDEQADYAFIKKIYEALSVQGDVFGMEQVLAFLEANPGMLQINRGIVRNEGYLRSLRHDGKVA